MVILCIYTIPYYTIGQVTGAMERLWHNFFRTGSKYYPSKIKKMGGEVEAVSSSSSSSSSSRSSKGSRGSWDFFETPLVLPKREQVSFLQQKTNNIFTYNIRAYLILRYHIYILSYHIK